MIQILDKDGKVLAQSDKSFSHYKRSSMRAAAEQKFIDSLYQPGAAEAQIVNSPTFIINFRFDSDGRSQHYFKK